jgi:DNA-binding NarL/FixJ family response regulator
MERITVALADDHALVRRGLALVIGLDPRLALLFEAGDGANFLAMAAKTAPNIAVIDLNLPDMPATEVARILIAEQKSRVIIVTGDLSQDAVQRSLAAGAEGYVAKSGDADEIMTAIHRVAAGERYLSPAVATPFAAARPAGPAELTPREGEVMQLIAKGYSSKEVARLLAISPATVRRHRESLMAKLDVHNVAELTALAMTM